MTDANLTSAAPTAAQEFVIHPETSLGHVHLTVSDLDAELDFYQNTLGLRLHRREGGTASLGVGGADLLRLTELPGAQRADRTTGLYHFAVLLPSKRELARVMARLFSQRYLNYPTDHVMTQTTYLSDPEGNGIELYADTPEEGFFGFANGQFVVRDNRNLGRTGRDALDVEALFRELRPGDRLDEPLPPGTRIGHVHLHIRDVDEAVRFYCGLLGFEPQGVSAQMGAAFVSAGGYHHHLGLNIWVGQGAPPPPPGSQGLRYFVVYLPNAAELERVAARVRAAGVSIEETEVGWLLHDPSQNGVCLAVRPAEN